MTAHRPAANLLFDAILFLAGSHSLLECTQPLLLGRIVRDRDLVERVLRGFLELLVNDIAHLVLAQAGVLGHCQ